jgi:hypothetical protein
MSRHRRHIPHAEPLVRVRGAPFTCRTLHAADGRWRGQYGERIECTLDKLHTITLAAIAGADHHEPASIEVIL